MIEIIDDNYNIKPATLIMSNNALEKKGVINNITDLTCKSNFNSSYELSFNVYKEMDGEVCNFWDDLLDTRVVYFKDIDTYFKIEISININDTTVKNVVGTSLCEYELSKIKLYNIEINTESDILRDEYEKPTKFYKKDDPKNSLLHRILEKAPHYHIGEVDLSLRNIQRSFSIDGDSILDFLQSLAEEIKCIFIFDTTTRTINVYDLLGYCLECGARDEFNNICTSCGSTNTVQGYGDDTGIFISRNNLAQEINVETNANQLINCLKLKAGDELMTSTIRSINPNGSEYIYDFSNEIKDDMPDELVKKLDSYDEKYDDIMKNYTPTFSDQAMVHDYNMLASKYNTDNYATYKYNETEDKKVLTNNSYAKIDQTLIGYEKLVNLYYDVIDFNLYLESSLLPTVEPFDNTAVSEIGKLTSEAFDCIGLQTCTPSTSNQTVETAIKTFTKVLVVGNYKITVNTSAWDYYGEDNDGYKYGIWSGNITLTSYNNAEDTATSEDLRFKVWDNYQYYVQQKITKTLKDYDEEYGSIYDIYKIEQTTHDTEFKNKLKYYSLARLNSFNDAYQSALDILIEVDQASEGADLYAPLYLPYYNRKQYISNEIETRIKEIETLDNLAKALDEIKLEVAKILDLKEYLGIKLWEIFNTYRSEDVYENSNFISDGLSNADLISRSKEFLELAKKELHKASRTQYTLTSTISNFMLMEEFEPFMEHFVLGNWIRLEADEKIYKLRLLSYQLDFSNINNLPLTFSTLSEVPNDMADIESILNSAKSMSNSFSYIEQQVNNSTKANAVVENWVEKGFEATKKIVNSAERQTVVYDRNGLLIRKLNDSEDGYEPEQIKIVNSTIAYTDNNWRSVKTAIGRFTYVDPITNEFKTAYGVNGEAIVGKLLLGENLGIYNENSTMTFDNNGLVLDTIGKDGTVQNIFQIRKNGTNLVSVDSDGNLVLSGQTKIIWGDMGNAEGLNDVLSGFEFDINGFKKKFEKIETTIEEIDVSQLFVSIVTKDSTILNEPNQTCTLNAQVLHKGMDATSEYTNASFSWTRTSNDTASDKKWNDAHKAMKTVVITPNDVDILASFSVKAVLPTVTQTSSALTILDKTDVPELTGHLDCNYPDYQIVNDDGSVFPNWTDFTLTPALLDKYFEVSLGDLTVVWKKRIGSNPETELDVERVVNNVLNVTENILTTDHPMVTYIAYCTYKTAIITLSKSFVLNVNGKTPTVMNIYSKNGVQFKNNVVKTELYPVVLKGVDDVTNSLDEQLFIWTRNSNDETSDKKWNDAHISKGTKLLSISNNDIDKLATFTCSLNDTYSTSIAQITLSVVEDGSTGIAGQDGVSVTSVTEEYYLSTSYESQVGGSWVSKPPVWQNGKYTWTRTKTTFSDGTSTSTSPICVTGGNGISAVSGDLDNDSCTIPCSANGTPISYAGAITTMSVRVGTTDTSNSWAYSIVKNNCDGTLSNNNRTFTLTSISSDNAYVDITATRAGYDSVTKRFNISKIKAGADGEDGIGIDATSYWLVCDTSTILKDKSGTLTPSDINIIGKSKTGNNPIVNYAGRFIISESLDGSAYVTKYTSSANEATKKYSPSKNIKSLKISFYLAGGTTTLLDEEIINVVSDGIDGQDGQDGQDGAPGKGVISIIESYYLSTSPTTLSGSSWSTSRPTWVNGKYMWTKSTITYTDNSTSETSPICVTGGNGQSGSNGVGVLSVDVEYYKSNSSTTLSGGSWVTTSPSWENGKYIWSKTITTYTDNTTNETNPVCITGGIGQSGKDGVSILSVTEYYLASSSSSGVTTSTSGWTTSTQTMTISNKYLWNYEVISFSNNTTSTTSPKIIGVYGESGKGISSIVNYYLASTSSSGVTTSTSGWTTTNQTITSINKYLWNYEVINYTTGSPTTTTPHIIGVYGEKGDTGASGTDGKTSHFHIKYSTVAKPTTASQLLDTPSTYIGTYVDYNATASTDPSKYTWARFQGAQGSQGNQGVPGINGEDGKTSYLHIKYSNDGGITFTSNSGETVGDYMGQCVDFNSADPTSVNSYIWSKIKGEQGAQGIKGIDGKDGISSYFHIRYSQNSNGNPMTDSAVNAIYIGTCSTNSSTAPTTYSSYKWSKIKGETGAKGDTGTPGAKGTDGKTSYLHIKYSDNGTTFTANNGETPGKYIGTYVDFTEADSTVFSAYTWVKIEGPQGLQGIKGADGKQYYTWLKYADTPTSGMSDSPDGKSYIGLAYNKTTANESNTYSDYTWSLIKGEKGDTGIAGQKGADGKTTYTWVKYATSASGANMSDDPTGKTYIGLAYNKTTITESTVASDYTWSLIKGDKGDKGDKGEQGAQGVQGPKGADGKQYYTWLKYADTPTSGMSDSPDGKSYIGLAYNKTNITESSNYSDYTWSLIKGDKGDVGVQGPKGTDGKTTYTWIKYATSASGANMSDSPSGKTYIGLAYNKTTSVESNTASDYTWSLIKGDKGDKGDTGAQGPQGVQGPKGADGKQYYTWLKYADTPTTGMSDSPTGKSYIGLAYNKTSATESSTYSDYTWSLIKGEKGDTGVQGPKGTDGKTTYTWVKYATSSSGANMSDSPDGKSYIGLAYNKTSATESTTASDYTWSLIKGDKGESGVSPINIMLSNEAHGFAANSASQAIATSITNNVTAYQGTTQIATTIGTISGTPTGMTITINDNGSAKTTLTIAVTASLTTKTGVVNIPVTAGGITQTKQFSYSLSPAGANGTSVTITNTSVTYQVGTSGTTAPTGTWVTTLPATSAGQYLWTRTIVTYSDGKSTTAYSVSRNPTNGTNGSSVTVSSSQTTYQASSSGTTVPTGTWSTTPVAGSPGQYVWTRTIVTYSDGKSATSYMIARNGTNGSNGATGVGISTYVSEYYKSTSATALSGGSWSTARPDWENGKYIWSRNKTTLTSGTVTYSEPICVTGGIGNTGSTGKGVSSINAEYYLSTSKTTQSGGSWVTTSPTWSSGKYLWSRHKIVYNNPTSTVYTTPVCDNSWEAVNEIQVGGRNYILIKKLSSYINYNSIPTVSETKLSTTWNKSYTGNTLTLSVNGFTPENAVYTLSGFLKVNDKIPTAKYLTGYASTYGSELKVNEYDPSTGYFVITQKYPGNSVWILHGPATRSSGSSDIVTFDKLKLEKGNKATDWTPSPEDVQEQIDNSIANVDVEYYLSTSSTTQSGGSWSTTAPTWQNGKYMWSRTKKTYGSGTVSTTTPVCIAGAQGSAGKGVTSIVEQYYKSTSATAQSGGSWGTAYPGWANGYYIWTRSVITYTDNTSTTTTPICVSGSTGSSGASAKLADIICTNQVFKAPANSTTYTPSTIVLTPSFQNATYSKWQYSVNGGTTWADVASGSNGLTIGTVNSVANCLTIANTSALFTASVTSIVFKLLTTTANVQDVITIARLKDGDTGPTGVGIKTVTNYYLATASASGVTTSTSGWTTTVQTVSASKKYLWNFERITYTNNSTSDTAPCIIGNFSIDGAQGAQGVGISTITEYYQISTSNTTAPTSWLTTVPTLTSTNKYLWNYEKIAYTNGTSKDTAKRVIGVYGEKGNDGASYWRSAGWVDVSDANTYDPNKYYPVVGTSLPTTAYNRIQVAVALNSGKKPAWSTHASGFSVNFDFSSMGSGWGTTSAETIIYADTYSHCSVSPASYTQLTNGSIPVLYLRGGGRYYVRTDYVCSWTPKPTGYTWENSNPSYVQTAPVLDSRPTPKGTNIKGVSVTKVEVFYYLSTSATSLSGGSWSTTVPTWADGKYMWSKQKTTLSNNTSTETAAVCITGGKGGTGATGSTGKGVSSITNEYYLSTSKTTQSGGSWVTTAPTWSSGKYVWTRSKIVWSNPTATTYTVPICDSSWEAVNEVEIGGTNLCIHSDDETTSTEYLVRRYTLSEDWVPGATYTLSIKGTYTAGSFGAWRDNGSVVISSGMAYDSTKGIAGLTFKCPNPANATDPKNILSIYNYPSTVAHNSTIEWVMLEKGNKASDWSPCPKDTQDDLNNIRQEVVKDYTQKITDTADGIKKEISGIIETIGENAKTTEGIQETVTNNLREFSSLTNVVNEVQDKLTGVTTLTEVLNMIKYDKTTATLTIQTTKNPNIANAQTFAIKIDPTELGFYQGSTKVAYINGEQLFINKAVVVTKLTLGNYNLEDGGSNGFTIS